MKRTLTTLLIGGLMLATSVFANEIKLYEYHDYKIYSILDQSMKMHGSLFSTKGDRIDVKNEYQAAQNVFLVENKATAFRALVDVGFGNAKSNLIKSLEIINIDPEEIQAVFITHIHPDHVGGLTKQNGKAAFPKAKIYIGRLEFESWEKDASRASLAVHFQPYKGRIVLMDYGKEIKQYGLKPLLFKGHTPGHTVYELTVTKGDSKKETLLFVGDILHAVDLQVRNPEYCARFDKNIDEAIASRKAIFSMEKNCFGAHITFPGVIRIQKRTENGKEEFTFSKVE